jgi:hypothetical protein
MVKSGLVKVGAGAGLGVAATYLFDPDNGRSRRARLRDQVRGRLRRDTRRLGQRLSYERGRLSGASYRLRHSEAGPVADDRMLTDRIRSQALGRFPDFVHRVTIDAYEGVVTLRGELDDRISIMQVEDAVGRVPGVERVSNLLHIPGEPAPNKAGAMRPTA